MATTQDDIRRWLKEAKKDKATHVVVVCDTFDWEDYPVSVKKGQDVQKVIADHSKDMQKVMEVYNLSMDIDKQLKEHRVWNV